MNVNKITVTCLNDLLQLVKQAEEKGAVKEALDLIEVNKTSLDSASLEAANNVAAYLKTKLIPTAQEAAARAQVDFAVLRTNIRNIFGKIKNTSLIDTSSIKPQDRSQTNMLLDNFIQNPGLFVHPNGKEVVLNNINSRMIDGLSGKEYDFRFMQAIQRLVDQRVIDENSMVILHTGHNIPMAHQLMSNGSLGKVGGVLDISKDTFPELSPKVESLIRKIIAGKGSETGLNSETITYINQQLAPYKQRILTQSQYEEPFLDGYKRAIMECTERNVNQAYTFKNVLDVETAGKGAKFIGVDFHRTANYDTSKLPSASSLQKAGIQKVIFLDESTPKSTYSPKECEQLYEPMTQSALHKVSMYINNIGELILKRDIEKAFDSAVELGEFIKPKDLQMKIKPPSASRIEEIQQLLQDGKFGYSTSEVTKSDMADYLQQLKKDIPVIIEGVDVLKLETVPLPLIKQIVPEVTRAERAELADYAKFAQLIQFINNLCPVK